MSLVNWTTGRVKKFLSGMASRLACGLQKFEVIASIPLTLSYISHCDNLIWMQLTGKYTMSMKDTKQKLKRRAAKAMKCNPAPTVGKKTSVDKKQ